MFLTEKKFYIHLSIAIVSFIAIVAVTLMSLDKCTRHATEQPMPNVVGLQAEEAIELYGNQFDFIIYDSVYVKDLPKGSIYQQNPRGGAKVKQGRNVYCVMVSKSPEKVKMPDLHTRSLREAIRILKSLEINVKELVFVDHVFKNAVVEQFVDDTIIKPETLLNKGSMVTLHVGKGQGLQEVQLPNLMGLSYRDAIITLNQNSLNVGIVNFDQDVPLEATAVYFTEPSYNKQAMVPLGQKVNLYLKDVNKIDHKKISYYQKVKDSIVSHFSGVSLLERDILLDSVDCLISGKKFDRNNLSRLLDTYNDGEQSQNEEETNDYQVNYYENE